jgi:putative ABC transport system permease protein
MLKNYFKIAWRNLLKHKLFSSINIGGLSIGLAAFWMITLFISDELSFDRFHEKSERIFRVVHSGRWEGGSFDLVPTSAPYASHLKNEYPEIEKAVRINAEGGGVIGYENKLLNTQDVIFADSNFFQVFTHHFIIGDPGSALSKPKSIVVCKSLAEKIFGSVEAALDKTIIFDKTEENIVTGVIEDVPKNSHLQFSAIRSLNPNFSGGWQEFNVVTYLLLKEKANYKNLQAKFPSFFQKYIKKEMGNLDYTLYLQPLTSIHLHSNLAYELGKNGDIKDVYVFVAVALIILIVAAINYMNLSTARALVRIQEVGVRKVIGSGRGELATMFITESILITILAGGMALMLIHLSLPYFHEISGKNLSLFQFGYGPTLLLFALFSLVLGGITGFYPAVFLTQFSTVNALKKQLGSLTGSTIFRKALVAFQFVISIVMISSVCVIYQQITFTNNKDLGFNKEQVFTFHLEQGNARKSVKALKEKLLTSPEIKGVAIASNPIGNNNLGGGGVFLENKGTFSDQTTLVQRILVDPDYLNTLQIELKKGRNFSYDFPGEINKAALVNEALVKKAGWKDPVGKRIRFYYDNEGHTAEATVIGVVKDFHVYSLQHKIEPLFIQIPLDDEMDNIYVRVNPGNSRKALKYTESVMKSFDPSAPFEAHFLNENFAKQYDGEIKQGQVLLVFTILSIVIACLGLFGLATYNIQQRTKEIGIRKILGASVGTIVTLLSKDYLQLIVIAAAIALPVAWIGMQKWLENFAYRIEIQWWVFVLAGLVSILIALITLCFQAIKAGISNPVKSLRNE